jgi:hypothetical protein
MNIVEAYKKYNENFVILISGITNDIELLGKWISQDYKIPVLNINNKHWDKIKDVNKLHQVILTGEYFPIDVITFPVDIHIHIKLSKQNLIIKLNNPNINKEIYPKYLLELKNEKIDNWIDGNDKSIQDIYNEIHKIVFRFIDHRLKK